MFAIVIIYPGCRDHRKNTDVNTEVFLMLYYKPGKGQLLFVNTVVQILIITIE